VGDNPYKNPFNPYPFGPPGGPGSPEPPKDPQQISTPSWLPATTPTPMPSPVPYGQGVSFGQAVLRLGRSGGGDFFFNLIFVGILWELWVCLYPLSALTGFFTWMYSIPLLRPLLPQMGVTDPGLCVVAGALAGAVVLWIASRYEHVLARYSAYRIPRHLVRLPLLGFASALAIQKFEGFRYNPTPAGLEPILKVPQNLAVVVGVMIAAHFVLWNWTSAREFWHRRLAGAQLRKRGM